MLPLRPRSVCDTSTHTHTHTHTHRERKLLPVILLAQAAALEPHDPNFFVVRPSFETTLMRWYSCKRINRDEVQLDVR